MKVLVYTIGIACYVLIAACESSESSRLNDDSLIQEAKQYLEEAKYPPTVYRPFIYQGNVIPNERKTSILKELGLITIEERVPN